MKKTYISLFSSSGVGDFGFYKAGFNLIATNELLDRRMKVQKANHISNDSQAYIVGDIQENEVKKKIYSQIKKYVSYKNSVDLLVATPPCQGISLANHHKNLEDKKRNSLVLQSIIVANEILPKIIVFENVKRFLKTACTDIDGVDRSIKTVIQKHLKKNYNIFSAEINFKDFGANSSRSRTIVIALNKKVFPNVDPVQLMPSKKRTKNLFEVIGDLPSLTEMGQIWETDILHEFRPYRQDMRQWIHDLKQGESAFDNKDPLKRPHRIVDGAIVQNVNKNSDKYRRQSWNKVAPAIHTRNDILASQNTVHPSDDRVFSIRELMRMMNVPDEFRWSEESYDKLNNYNLEDKKVWLKKNEINIRQSLGEAVPTSIFYDIGKKAARLIDENTTNGIKSDRQQFIR